MPGTWRPIDFSAATLYLPLLKVTISFVASIVMVALAGRFLPQTQMFQHLTLSTVVPNADEERDLHGLEGVAHSDLRPGGTAYFNGRKLDVVTHGNYIPRATPIRITEVHGNRIVVDAVS